MYTAASCGPWALALLVLSRTALEYLSVNFDRIVVVVTTTYMTCMTVIHLTMMMMTMNPMNDECHVDVDVDVEVSLLETFRLLFYSELFSFMHYLSYLELMHLHLDLHLHPHLNLNFPPALPSE